jgi:hypothetical protein
MSNTELILKHEKSIKILKGIEHFKNKKTVLQRGLDGLLFDVFRNEHLNKIDTIEKCIKRLELSYENNN